MIDALYNGDISELVKAQGKTRTEWLELFENNAQILHENVNKEDFTGHPQHIQEALILRLNLHEKILADAYKKWGVGSELNVLA